MAEWGNEMPYQGQGQYSGFHPGSNFPAFEGDASQGGQEEEPPPPSPTEPVNPLDYTTLPIGYTKNDEILVVGDGDFSFSRGLWARLGTGDKMTCTNLDTKHSLLAKYQRAVENANFLLDHHCNVGLGVDLMSRRFAYDFPKRFDIVVFNFPHTSVDNLSSRYDSISSNRVLLRVLFEQCRAILNPKGRLHVTIKSGYPYSHWQISELARENGCYETATRRQFFAAAFPGYQHRHTNRDMAAEIKDAYTWEFTLKEGCQAGRQEAISGALIKKACHQEEESTLRKPNKSLQAHGSAPASAPVAPQAKPVSGEKRPAGSPPEGEPDAKKPKD